MALLYCRGREETRMEGKRAAAAALYCYIDIDVTN
jgi:hypothetical protein